MRASPLTVAVLREMGAPSDVVAAYREAVRRFGARNWVSGIAVGRKLRNGRLVTSPRWVVAIHVKRKRAKTSVAKHNVVPKEIGGVPTDVISGRYRRCAKALPTTPATLRPGMSIASLKGSGGTIGGIVRDAQGVRYLITAGHVLRDGGGKKDTPVVHPPSTAGASGDQAGTTVAVHLTLDTGVAALSVGVSAANTALSGVRIKRPIVATIDMKVAMSGAGAPGIRRGRVLQVGRTSANGVSPVMFIKGTGVGPASVKGDSGGMWYDTDSEAAVGVHVEGDPDGQAVATLAPHALAGVSATLQKALMWT